MDGMEHPAHDKKPASGGRQIGWKLIQAAIAGGAVWFAIDDLNQGSSPPGGSVAFLLAAGLFGYAGAVALTHAATWLLDRANVFLSRLRRPVSDNPDLSGGRVEGPATGVRLSKPAEQFGPVRIGDDLR